MYSKEIVVCNPTGLHARPASRLVAKAGKFKSKITLRRPEDDSGHDVKSILMLLALGLSKGEKGILSAEGDDEEQAVNELAAFIEGLTE